MISDFDKNLYDLQTTWTLLRSILRKRKIEKIYGKN